MPKLLRNEKCDLRSDEGGAAFIEFAFSFPILMILVLSGVELTNYVVSNHQVRQIGAMTADNASRVRTKMSEEYVNQLFTGVDKAGEGLDFETRGRVILSSIQENNDADGQWIRWQRCFGDLAVNSAHGAQDKGKDDTSLPHVSGIAAQPGSGIMFAEVSYDYEPLFPNFFTNNRRLSHEVAFVVRQRTDFGIQGTGASTCP